MSDNDGIPQRFNDSDDWKLFVEDLRKLAKNFLVQIETLFDKSLLDFETTQQNKRDYTLHHVIATHETLTNVLIDSMMKNIAYEAVVHNKPDLGEEKIKDIYQFFTENFKDDFKDRREEFVKLLTEQSKRSIH